MSKARADALRRRGKIRPSAIDHIGQILFRLGEFGAVAWYAFGAFVLHQKTQNGAHLFDAFVYLGIGVICYSVGWIIRFLLTGNTHLI